MNGQMDRPSVPGKNLTLGLDIELQMLGERLMQNKIGSIVAIEPSTGEILCMVSSPTYDPHLMIGRQRGKNHGMLQADKQKPLLNRAIMGTYPPGSTFKTAQALTFLQEGIVQEETPSFPCSHGFIHRGLRVGCHGHASPLPLVPAIATSCNAYFCWGLYRMFGDKKYGSPQKAITVWKDHMVQQGFGYRLNTDLPGEQRGLIPNAQFYDKAYRGSWNGLTVISIAIGQGEILTTPLQIANLGATIANRGYYIAPHIVKEIEDNELDSIYRTPHYTGIDRSYYEMVVKGMRASVTGSTGSGTCRLINSMLPDVEACGKTGTAQNPHGKDHSVFMGFAPMNDPKIAIVVYVENGGWGATYGVPIGALMMDQYLHGKLSPTNEAIAEDFSKRTVLGIPRITGIQTTVLNILQPFVKLFTGNIQCTAEVECIERLNLAGYINHIISRLIKYQQFAVTIINGTARRKLHAIQERIAVGVLFIIIRHDLQIEQPAHINKDYDYCHQSNHIFPFFQNIILCHCFPPKKALPRLSLMPESYFFTIPSNAKTHATVSRVLAAIRNNRIPKWANEKNSNVSNRA